MENYNQDYLKHWGIKGQRWGVRRYQNADGTLTTAGKKRYNKEMERVKAEEAKVKAKQKVLNTKKKTQAKIDDLEARKKAIEAQKKAMKEEEKALKSSKRKIEPRLKRKKEETIEERRERLLKSVDAKELYANKHLLTTDEIQNRLNRIDWEEKLRQKIPVEPKVDKNAKFIDAVKKVTNTYKTIDDAYSAVAKSSIGKTISDALGLDDKKKKDAKNIKRVDLEDLAKNYKNKSLEELSDGAKAAKNLQDINNFLKNVPIVEETSNTTDTNSGGTDDKKKTDEDKKK